MLRLLTFFLLGLLFPLASSVAEDHRGTIKFVTLEWPPYLGEKLPEQGLSIKILRAAFAVEGFTNVEVAFLPWSRALAELEHNSDVTGCLLAYYSKEREAKYLYSEPMSLSPIHFAYHKDNPVKWKTYADLKDKKIGVVQDYINNEEIDRLIADKKIVADPAASDLSNLEKLALKRTDLAIIDINVFKYLTIKSPELKDHRDKLAIDPRSLDDKKLYVLFSKYAAHEKWHKVFNRGLKKLNVPEITKKYMEQL